MDVRERVVALAARLVADGERPGPEAADPVNVPMVRHWVEAVGDTNPIYLSEGAAVAAGHPGLVAPPAMAQVWTMAGFTSGSPEDADDAGGDAAAQILSLLDAAGFTGVVATNCEHSYDRYLRVGERVRSTVRMGEVTGPKRTAMGEGYFVTWHTTWYVGEERVARMLFRVLKFRPHSSAAPPDAAATRDAAGAAPGDARGAPAAATTPSDAGRRDAGAVVSPRGTAAPYPLRPAVNRDTAFFWEGAAAGELRVQRCAGCGALRHPPGPVCPQCRSMEWDHVVAAGRGEVASFVVHHHPPVPGRDVPFVVAVVALPEGVRVVGDVLDVAPGDVYVGMPVVVTFERVDDDLVLPQWRPRRPGPAEPGTARAGDRLPDLAVPLTRSLIVATALATRDFTPVHHDPEVARAQGSADVFLNILTSMGLVQRYVTDWAGPAARVHSLSVRLGAPAYAGDTLHVTGEITSRDGDAGTIAVTATDSLGPHITATVTLTVPEAAHAAGSTVLAPAFGRGGEGGQNTTSASGQSGAGGDAVRHGTGGAAARGASPVAGRGGMAGKAAIAGIGATEFSKDSGRSELRLAAEATLAALDDAGLTPADVDGLVTFAMDTTAEIDLAAAVGIPGLRFFDRIEYGGGAACATVHHAAMAVATGAADVVVCYRALNERSGQRFGRPDAGFAAAPTSQGIELSWHVPFGLMTPAAWVAMFARRYQHEYGATSEDFGRVAVADRRHAATNPSAWFYRKPITLADHQASRWVAEPLHLLDCCQESDGAVALVITSAERARDLARPPAIVSAAAQGSATGQMMMTSYYRPDGPDGPDGMAGLPEMGLVGGQLWRQAGIGPADVATAVLYDHFTPFVLVQLEELGFCGRGEAPGFLADGGIELGGRLPVNTHGGQLGEAYIHGMNGIAEAVRQVRGDAVNQVPDAHHVLVTAGTGVPTSGLILAADR